jgi:ADP-ribose pyrophosphatase YjhB (NUDIX family)
MMSDDPRHIVGVSGVVRDDEGRVLLVRTPRRGWEPPGGQVELGEDLQTALKREIREESGCEVDVGRLVGVYSNVGSHIVMFTFLCAWRVGEPCGGNECMDARWSEPEEAIGLVTHPANKAKLRDALSGFGVVYRAYRFRPEGGEPYAGYETLVESTF